MEDQRWCTYAGVYQAFAWQQGAIGMPTTFRLPDEGFFSTRGPLMDGFSLVDFMAVVRDIDDAGIHYWHYYEAAGDRFLVLTCTEDFSQNYLTDAMRDDYHTAYVEDYWKEVT